MSLLEVRDIEVFYGSVQALRRVSLDVEAGERVALLGANGAGKTTTLRTISGLLSPRSGSVLFAGEEIGGIAAHEVVSRGIAHGPEGRALFPGLTVEENLRFGYLPRLRSNGRGLGAGRAAEISNDIRGWWHVDQFVAGGVAALRRLRDWRPSKSDSEYDRQLERVFEYFPRLRERRAQLAGTLSGGEQQMLVVARALMSAPKLLIVDELSLGLAPKIVSLLFDIIREVNREGTAVLIVEQFVHMALANTDRAYVLTKGEVVLEGRSVDLAESEELIASYLGGDEGHADATQTTTRDARAPGGGRGNSPTRSRSRRAPPSSVKRPARSRRGRRV